MARLRRPVVAAALLCLAACGSDYPAGHHRPADGGGGSGGAGGTGGDETCGVPVPLDDACARGNEVEIEVDVRCGRLSAEDGAALLAYTRASCEAGFWGIEPTIAEGVSRGRVTYDGEAFACCLERDRTASCEDEGDTHWSCLAAVYRPLSGLGDPCGGNIDCSGGICAVHACAPTCVPLPSVGEPCFEGIYCTEECDRSADPPICRPWPAEGQACDGICAHGLECIPGDQPWVCGRWVEIGERCGPGRGCPGACVDRGADGWGNCAPARLEGEACEPPLVPCADGLYCGSDGLCRAPAGPGESCRIGDAYYGACRYPYRCSPSRGTCVLGPFMGEPCDEAGECDWGSCFDGVCPVYVDEEPQPGDHCPGEDFWCGDHLICENRQCVEGCR